MHKPPEYTGKGTGPAIRPDGAWNRPEPYCPAGELAEAVNTALFLRRPLLLEGEPGSGKTRLAYAVAWELGWPLHDCYVRSTSKAEDLLYEFDQLNRLYDIQTACAKAMMPALPDLPKTKIPKMEDKHTYVRMKPLGRAIEDAETDRPSVVLIDEIDKADIDFPNDLLQVLEEWRFKIREDNDRPVDALKGMPEKDRRHVLPLVIVTSNRERDLPPAFLRRCLYFFIPFPDEKTLMKILDAHKIDPVDKLFETAVNRFMELRNVTQFQWRKPPGTSELILWVRKLENAVREGKETLESLKIKRLPKLPFREILVKTDEDRKSLASLDRSA